MHRNDPRAEELRALLGRILAPIRRSHETPLRFEIDSHGIADAALIGFRPGELGSDGESLTSALNSLVEKTLLAENATPPPTGGTADSSTPPTPNQKNPPSLAAWLDSLFDVMRDVDHRAFEILSLRLDGFEDRDIADRLGTGLRLVKRITRDMQTHWKKASGK